MKKAHAFGDEVCFDFYYLEKQCGDEKKLGTSHHFLFSQSIFFMLYVARSIFSVPRFACPNYAFLMRKKRILGFIFLVLCGSIGEYFLSSIFMATLSIPLTSHLEKILQMLVNNGVASSKEAAAQRAIETLAEQQAVGDVLESEREVEEGKVVYGNLRELI